MGSGCSLEEMKKAHQVSNHQRDDHRIILRRLKNHQHRGHGGALPQVIPYWDISRQTTWGSWHVFTFLLTVSHQPRIARRILRVWPHRRRTCHIGNVWYSSFPFRVLANQVIRASSPERWLAILTRVSQIPSYLEAQLSNLKIERDISTTTTQTASRTAQSSECSEQQEGTTAREPSLSQQAMWKQVGEAHEDFPSCRRARQPSIEASI